MPPQSTPRVDPAITVACVSYRYRSGVCALSNVSLRLQPAEHTVLIGPSGSGKSTLIDCIAGRLRPCSGTIRCEGVIASIYQDLWLVPERSALGNVLDGALGRVGTLRSLARMPTEERNYAAELLERVGLSGRMHAQVRHLSGGERQRVAVARALMQRPSILLADEPVSSLDCETADEVTRLLKSLCHERSVTLVSVLHDETLANKYGDRLVRLCAGRIISDTASTASASVCCQETDDRLLNTDNVTSLAPPHRLAPSQRSVTAALESHPVRPRWMSPIALVVIGLVVMGVYVVSGIGLGLHHTSDRSIINGLSGFLYALVPKSWSEIVAIPWGRLSLSLIETLQMSLIGTTASVMLAYPLAIVSARNTGPWFLRPVCRQVLNAARTVPSLIWALLFVAAVGFGPLAGVLALALYSVGYLGKFFYEAFENTARETQDVLQEIGASGVQRFVRAVAPSSRPAIAAACLFMLEYNVRAASILGIVDAGGIGYYIKFYLDIRNFPSALACLLLIFLVVVLLDSVSSRLRERLLGSREPRRSGG